MAHHRVHQGAGYKRALLSPHTRASGINDIFACKIQNLGNFFAYGIQNLAMEPGILLNEPGITLKAGIQDPLTKNPESNTWNAKSKTVLDSLTRGYSHRR